MPLIPFYYSLAVAIYAESVIPGTILNKGTTNIINLCLLPTMEDDSFQNYATRTREDNDQVSNLGENWIKFRDYALLNQDQVRLSQILVKIFFIIFSGE